MNKSHLASIVKSQLATAASVGDWEGREEEAAEAVNRIYIALLEAAPTDIDEDRFTQILHDVGADYGSEMNLLTLSDKEIAGYVGAVFAQPARRFPGISEDNIMKITTTQFAHNYHDSTISGSNTYACGFYTLHQIDVYNEIEINGEKFQAVYQCGNDFLHGDYNCPDPRLSLSDYAGGSGTSRLIFKIWAAGENEIESLEGDDLQEFCESLSDYTEYTSYTAAELMQIYRAIVDNGFLATEYMDSLELADTEEAEEE